MLEPSGFIGRLVGALQNRAGAADELSPGRTVRARVVSRISGNTWRLAVGERLIDARVTVPLRQEQVFLARVERSAGEIILRQILSPHTGTPLERVTSAAGVPNDALSQGIITHLVHTQRSLDPQHIARLYRLARRLGVTDRRGARLVAATAGKGLLPEGAEAFRALLDAVDLPEGLDDDAAPPRDDNGRRRGGRGGREHPGHPGGRENADTGGGGGGDPGGRDRGDDQEDSKDAEAESARRLAVIVGGTGARGSEGPGVEESGIASEETHPIQAFNHLAGPDGQWVAIPLRFTAGDEERRAVLRLYRAERGDSFGYAVLEVGLEGRRISFALHRTGGGYGVTVHAHEKDATAARQLAHLIESHEGITQLAFGESVESFDGFSTEDLSAIVYGIDTDV